MKPELPGTVISSQKNIGIIKAIAAKDDIIFINIKSNRKLVTFQFVKKLFDILAQYKTTVDMISISGIYVSLTIDNAKFIDKIKNDISDYGYIEIKKNQTIVCIVGDLITSKSNIVINALISIKKSTINMICYGASKNSVSLLINTLNKYEIMNLLHNDIFNANCDY
ncbi:MAG: hypothetical protein IR527_02625 [Bacteroides sp.]|nr:MAG: hypothetical protein IR527_02625 [Bacteroides sp.]